MFIWNNTWTKTKTCLNNDAKEEEKQWLNGQIVHYL